jgi:hypothetical protein
VVVVAVVPVEAAMGIQVLQGGRLFLEWGIMEGLAKLLGLPLLWQPEEVVEQEQ